MGDVSAHTNDLRPAGQCHEPPLARYHLFASLNRLTLCLWYRSGDQLARTTVSYSRSNLARTSPGDKWLNEIGELCRQMGFNMGRGGRVSVYSGYLLVRDFIVYPTLLFITSFIIPVRDDIHQVLINMNRSCDVWHNFIMKTTYQIPTSSDHALDFF